MPSSTRTRIALHICGTMWASSPTSSIRVLGRTGGIVTGGGHTSVATLVRNDNVSFGSLRQSKRPEAEGFGAGLE